MSDTYLFVSLTIFMILAGSLLPFIQEDFNSTVTAPPINATVNDLGDSTKLTATGGLSVIFSIGKMFFWYFGDIPFWLEIGLLIIKAMFWILFVKIFIRGVGS